MTFKELIQTGQCSISTIDAWVEIWRKEKGVGQSLQAFLGLNRISDLADAGERWFGAAAQQWAFAGV